MSDPSTYEPVDVSRVTDPEIIALARLDAELEAQHRAVMAALDADQLDQRGASEAPTLTTPKNRPSTTTN